MDLPGTADVTSTRAVSVYHREERKGTTLSDGPKKFETARIRELRSTDLHATDARTLNQIEEYGCSVLSVGRDCAEDFAWTYTIGIHDTCGQPDLITVGLNFGVAHRLLNDSAHLLREGVELSKGRHANLLGKVDCEFRPVDQKWVRHLMNWANWYYGRTDYPVLQAVYPDLENRFPEDDNFDKEFAQPLMQPGAAFTNIERDFWDSIDGEAKFADWKFPDKPHTKAFLSKAVQEGKEWITFVTHDLSDGAWQIFGETGVEEGGLKLTCLHHIVEKDPTLNELADLPKGWWAEREAPGQPWERYEHVPDDAED
jgi:hypothetical protein